MDTIVLRVSDLIALAENLKKDNMDFVQLSLEPADDSDPDDVIPPMVFVSATKRSDRDMIFDYEEIEEAEEGLTTFSASSSSTNITR